MIPTPVRQEGSPVVSGGEPADADVCPECGRDLTAIDLADVEFELWHALLVTGVFGFMVFTAGHAVVHKRRPRSALTWLYFCLFLPALGSALYWLLGRNRIHMRARKMFKRWRAEVVAQGRERLAAADVSEAPSSHLRSLGTITEKLTHWPLFSGNSVRPMYQGEQVFDAMLSAIGAARTSVYLQTYIFKRGEVGQRFLEALVAAHDRGVDVRVLLDGVGEWYSFPGESRRLQARGVQTAIFLKPSLWRPNLHMNLRNHRKILVVDSDVAFTGGMNISDEHLDGDGSGYRVKDVHFELRGPVVAQIEQAFFEDWSFTTGDAFPDRPLVIPDPAGPAHCRGILDGPNEDLGRLEWIFVAAISAAQRRVRIMTPYFIPSRELTAALIGSSLRGVDIELHLPAKNNLPLVAWASRAYLWEFLRKGVRIYDQPAPFVHRKLMVIDDVYCQLGSANLDPRSLRLNFEFNVEVFDENLAADMNRHFDESRARAHEVTLEEVDGRKFPVRFRDAMARLLSPYL